MLLFQKMRLSHLLTVHEKFCPVEKHEQKELAYTLRNKAFTKACNSRADFQLLNKSHLY